MIRVGTQPERPIRCVAHAHAAAGVAAVYKEMRPRPGPALGGQRHTRRRRWPLGDARSLRWRSSRASLHTRARASARTKCVTSSWRWRAARRWRTAWAARPTTSSWSAGGWRSWRTRTTRRRTTSWSGPSSPPTRCWRSTGSRETSSSSTGSSPVKISKWYSAHRWEGDASFFRFYVLLLSYHIRRWKQSCRWRRWQAAVNYK